MLATLRHLAREAVIFTLIGPFAFVVGYWTVQAFNAPHRSPYTTVKTCDSWLAVNAPKQDRRLPADGNQAADDWKDVPAPQTPDLEFQKAQPITVPCVEIQTLKKRSTTPPWFLYHSPTIVQLSKDKGFLAASQADQIAYLKSVDPAFVTYSAPEQQAYLKWIVETVADPRFNPDVPYKDALVWDAKFDSATGLPYFDDKDAFYTQGYNGAWFQFAPGTPRSSIARTLNRTPLVDYIHPGDAALVALVFGWPLGLGAWFAYRIIRFAIKG